MRTRYVLIDFENVQPASLAGLEAEHFRVLVFVGASQNKLNFETVDALQRLGFRAEYVKITGNGSNALDFHIAFHIGQRAAQDPTAFFHIISKDTGFDPLIQHLKERKIFATRCSGIEEVPRRGTGVEEIPQRKLESPKGPPEKLALVIADLQRRGASRPRTLKTLSSTINALFQKSLSEGEIHALLNGLKSRGVIAIDKDRITYAIPSSQA